MIGIDDNNNNFYYLSYKEVLQPNLTTVGKILLIPNSGNKRKKGMKFPIPVIHSTM